MTVVVAVVAAVGCVGWGADAALRAAFGHDNPEVLRAMRRDPLASYVPPSVIGRPSVLTSEAGTAMGMPNYGKFDRTWRVRRSDARAAFAQAMRDAARRGWHFDDVSYIPRYVRYGVPDKTSVVRLVYGQNGPRAPVPMLLTLTLSDDPDRYDEMGPPNPVYAAITVSLESRLTKLTETP